MRVEPDDRQPLVPGGEALDGADVRAAAPAQHERPLRQRGGERERLLAERVLLDHGHLGIGERQLRGLGHRLAAVAPGAGNAHEPGAELPPAGVALVVGPSATAVYVLQ